MNRQETAQILTLLAGNYSSISDKTKEQKQTMINTWYECLNDLEYPLVLQATKKSIISSPYPPTIHDIRKNAAEITNPISKKTAIEAWNEAYKMICRGTYMTQEEFDKASPEVKSFFGDVRQVSELAKSDIDVVNSVTKGQFLKQYDALVQRDKEQMMLPTQMQDMSKQLADKMSIKQIGG